MVKHYSIGKRYDYPSCCISMFYVRLYTTYPIMYVLSKLFNFVIYTDHIFDPQVKCPYHFIRSVLKGYTKVRCKRIVYLR